MFFFCYFLTSVLANLIFEKGYQVLTNTKKIFNFYFNYIALLKIYELIYESLYFIIYFIKINEF